MHTLCADVRLYSPAAGLQVGPRAAGGVFQGQGLRGKVSYLATALSKSLALVCCKTPVFRPILLVLLCFLNKLTLSCGVSGLLSTLHRKGSVLVSCPNCGPC